MTWFGHASCLVELDGVRLLMDPVWSERCSPSQHVGPRRLHPVPVPLSGLGRIDAVVISHDHYDHLDMATIRELVDLTQAVVPGAARRRRPPRLLGRARRAGRRVRLGGGPRRPGCARDRRRGAALLRARPAPRRHPVGLVGGRGAGRQGLLQRRQRLLRRLRPARRPARAVRRLADGRGCVRPGLARHPPEPRGGRRGDPPAARWAADADPLVHLRAGPAPVGRAGRAAARRGGHPGCAGGRAAGRASGSMRPIRPVWTPGGSSGSPTAPPPKPESHRRAAPDLVSRVDASCPIIVSGATCLRPGTHEKDRAT